jgi:hypothetical protein
MKEKSKFICLRCGNLKNKGESNDVCECKDCTKDEQFVLCKNKNEKCFECYHIRTNDHSDKSKLKCDNIKENWYRCESCNVRIQEGKINYHQRDFILKGCLECHRVHYNGYECKGKKENEKANDRNEQTKKIEQIPKNVKKKFPSN